MTNSLAKTKEYLLLSLFSGHLFASNIPNQETLVRCSIGQDSQGYFFPTTSVLFFLNSLSLLQSFLCNNHVNSRLLVIAFVEKVRLSRGSPKITEGCLFPLHRLRASITVAMRNEKESCRITGIFKKSENVKDSFG